MIQLLVIADDLTGALDTGVQLAKKGISTEVRIVSGTEVKTQGEELGEDALAISAQVIVADTESRHLPAEDASLRVEQVVRWGIAHGIEAYYKKTDSTLRGNIGPEIAALWKTAERGSIIFAPAFPALGRVTKKGRQFVNGLPLEKTTFARDRLNPITTGSVSEIIEKDTNIGISSVEPLNLSSLLTGTEDRSATNQIIVVDGETEQDLAETAQAVKSHFESRRPLLLAGCAGFAAYLPEILGIKENSEIQVCIEGPLLAVNGSLNPVSLGQIRSAIQGGFEDFPLRPSDILRSRDQIQTELTSALKLLRPCVLRNVLSPEEIEDYLAKSEVQGIPREELHLLLPKIYGKIIRDISSRVAIGTLVVFGGDTLVGILEAFGKKSLSPLAEIFPGVVVAEMPGITNPRYLVTKAGGFGQDNLLVKLLESL